ncbi:hypothetical protein Barb6_03662 [Bacteroidales bacterium Barb6]|nr:hypothetical protein Barb6_03662 [Bacteroidales bacterium Barb6]
MLFLRLLRLVVIVLIVYVLFLVLIVLVLLIIIVLTDGLFINNLLVGGRLCNGRSGRLYNNLYDRLRLAFHQMLFRLLF